jgi:hypothetical protein
MLGQSLAILNEIRDMQGIAITLASMARVHLARGNITQALATFRSSLLQNYEIGNKIEIATDLEGIAEALSVDIEQPGGHHAFHLAIRLLAVADHLRLTAGTPRSAAEHAEFQHVIAQLRSQLPENAFETEFKIGWLMTIKQAVEAVVDCLPKAETSSTILG